jgi:hypothetical protein
MSAVVRFNTNVVDGELSTEPPVSVYVTSGLDPTIVIADTVNVEPSTVSEKTNRS